MNNFKSIKLIIGSVLAIVSFSQFSYAETAYITKSTDNLSKIVSQFYSDSELSRSQILVGIFQKNPAAFKRQNMNFLKRNQLLVLPEETELETVDKTQANELLILHTSLQRRGIKESPKDFVLNQQKEKSEKIESRQLEQQSKINNLEKESEGLKRRLEKLIEEKQIRDSKLREIENSIKASLQSKSTNENKSNNNKKKLSEENTASDSLLKELEEKNQVLQKQLHKSKSELAENIQSNIVLERRLNNLKQDESGLISEAETALIPTNAINNSTDRTEGSIDMGSVGNERKSKLIWPVAGLLLFGLLVWFWKIATKNKNINDDDLQIPMSDGFIEDRFELNEESMDGYLQNSVKLDVANAYIAANDVDAAQDILRQVIEEGDEEQKILAKKAIGAL